MASFRKVAGLKHLFAGFSLVLWIGVSCTNEDAYDAMLQVLLTHDVHELHVDNIHDVRDWLVLDVREYKEFSVSHLPGAYWVGSEIDFSTLPDSIDFDTAILVYCSVGYRSEEAARILQSKGFTQVSNLYGGIFSWVNEGRPVFDSLGGQTERVHAYNQTWSIWLKHGEKVY
jgi:rhodanese-related sulfurtransferase